MFLFLILFRQDIKRVNASCKLTNLLTQAGTDVRFDTRQAQHVYVMYTYIYSVPKGYCGQAKQHSL